jgi:ferredoxin
MSMQIEGVKGKVYEERPGFPTQYGPHRTDTQPGFPLVPHEVYRDLTIVFILMAILFAMTAVATPPLGKPRSPALSDIIVPDWYLLFSWGFLQVAEVFPAFELGSPFGPVRFNAQLWGNILSGVHLIVLFLWPFLDRGRASRPAKAPFRSAFGLSFFIVLIAGASLYSIRFFVFDKWGWITDDSLKLWMVLPPLYVFVVSYVGLLRLGYRPVHWWLVALLGVAAAAYWLNAAVLYVFLPLANGADVASLIASLADPRVQLLTLFLVLPGVLLATIWFAVTFLSERNAKTVGRLMTLGTLVLLTAIWQMAWAANPALLDPTLQAWGASMHTFIGLPVLSVALAWAGLRTPYSTYEYLLNECYQCGKCHTVCPVTKVEDDALGGLNLVYNIFKKQHDGVPLWTCLACDACSAVCPLDIKYSDYILEERAKVARRPTLTDGGERRNA